MLKQMMWTGVLVALLAGCASRDGGAVRPSLSLSATKTVAAAPVVEVPVEASAVVEENLMAEDLAASLETGVTFYRLRAGDPIIIHLRGIYPKDEQVEDIVDEDGNVTIPLIGDIQAVGKSTAQLEGDIRRMYIDGGYYRDITVNAVMPSQHYFIRGEIRTPGRYPVVSGITIMQAIAAGGGYTEFASKRNLKLIRGGRTITVNIRDIERNPDQDIRLESGDVLVIERSIL
jgi:polysaccharide export outer membrane protein